MDIADVRIREDKKKELCHICKTALLPILTIFPNHQLNSTSYTRPSLTRKTVFIVFVLENVNICHKHKI